MPETDKLAKLIQHRQEQEKKNDRLRLHKNTIENDKLHVLVTHLDWNKVLRGRELANAEEEYIRKLEKIYNRQRIIEEKRIEDEEKRLKDREAKKLSLEKVQKSSELSDKERRRRYNNERQITTKSFMSKAKSLSGGYRDNDPPKVYYKRKGLVPPDRMVNPEISAEAQASFGGGSMTPSSAEHLYRSSMLPKETRHGIEGPHSRPPSRSVSVRTHSARSGRSEPLMSMTSLSDDDVYDDDAINEVIRVNVRPSTAPGKRVKVKKQEVMVTELTSAKHGFAEQRQVGVEPEIQTIKVEQPNNVEKAPGRPATAGASVRFVSGLKPERNNRPQISSARRRGSLKMPAMIMFHKRSSSAGAGANGARAGSAPPRIRSSRSDSQQVMMSNAEQDRIRKKIHEKAECFHAERTKRAVMAMMKVQGESIPRRIQSAASTRELPFLRNYLRHTNNFTRNIALSTMASTKKSDEMQAMLGYIDRCESGMALLDTNQAKTVLIETTRDRNQKLNTNVRAFVEVR